MRARIGDRFSHRARFGRCDQSRDYARTAAPYFCEGLIRSENVTSYENIRQRTRGPIAGGEQFGDKWDINQLIERELIDYTRVTLPNDRPGLGVQVDRNRLTQIGRSILTAPAC